MRIAIIHDTRDKGRGDHGMQLAFRGLPGADIVALADNNASAAAKRLAQTGARRHYADWREMLQRERPNIVVLPSRLPGDHIEPVRRAAAMGCHVLCEKPLAATLRDADEMVRLAREHGIKIAVGHLARYARQFTTMRRMIAEGDIGRPLAFYGRGKEDERGGGEDMAVLGTHILDIGDFLFGQNGPPQCLHGDVRVEGRPLAATDRADTSEDIGPAAGDEVFATWRWPGGARGIFESRRGLYRPDGPVRMGVTVAGTEGCLALRYDSGERVLRRAAGGFPPEDESRFEVVPLDPDEAIPGAEPLGDFPEYLGYFLLNNRLAAWDLMSAAQSGGEPAANAENARLALEMQLAIYRSSLTGRAVDLPLTERGHTLERV